jgi:hypothetical protein
MKGMTDREINGNHDGVMGWIAQPGMVPAGMGRWFGSDIAAGGSTVDDRQAGWSWSFLGWQAVG